MRLSTLASIAKGGRLGALRRVLGMSREVTRAHFLASAARSGVLAALSESPCSTEQLAQRLGVPDAGRETLAAWLAVGESSGELAREGGQWRLAGQAARALSRGANDDLGALLEEVVTLHAKLLLEGPGRMRESRPFTLADQDGRLIARSSRVLEPLVREVVDEHVPQRGAFRLLEVGCGSGTHLRHAAERNGELSALGLEVQPEVAQQARENLAQWGVGGRVRVEAGDLRVRAPQAAFDLVTLHNNIYYFPVAERVAVLRHARGFLVPGGKLLLTTACRGGSPASAVLHLWGELTEGCGGLPQPEELCAQLAEAGFEAVHARNVGAPLERFYAFSAVQPGAKP